MQNWLLQRAYLTPKRQALQFEGRTYTWYTLVEQAKRRAGQLITAGITPHSRIALLSPNSDELVITIYAGMLLQCELVMCNCRLSATEIQAQLQDAEVTQVIATSEQQHKVASNVILLEEVQQKEVRIVDMATEWQEQNTLSIMYTSGTTGSPKGVRQTYGNHLSSALSASLNVGMSPEDVWLCTMPLFHVSGFSILMRAVVYGNEVLLYERFDTAEVVHQIITGKATHMSVVAYTLAQILTQLEQQNLDVPPSFKLMLAGGGAIPERYLLRAQQANIRIAQTYGMTETCSQTATLPPQDALRKLGSTGKPLFFNAMRIEGTTEPFIQGEICVKGPHVTPAYIGKFATRNTMQDGWLHTGDIGYFDDEGYLYVVDRRADLIISGGENIYPAEIEQVLLGHAMVLEAGVCGIEDERWGSVPAAFIVVTTSYRQEEVEAYCKTHLASYKCPKHWFVVSQLPRNASNKIMRHQLRELLT